LQSIALAKLRRALSNKERLLETGLLVAA
jgi:hypothetical protein